jgi:hypothetical protein
MAGSILQLRVRPLADLRSAPNSQGGCRVM